MEMMISEIIITQPMKDAVLATCPNVPPINAVKTIAVANIFRQMESHLFKFALASSSMGSL
jgi:hypothetical protein